MPKPAETLPFFYSVSCVTATDCVAAGEYSGLKQWVPIVETWNGTIWTIKEPPIMTGAESKEVTVLSAISCVSSAACTAVGTFENTAKKALPYVETWNGTTWTAKELPIPSGAKWAHLNGVSCTAATACLATGEYESSTGVSEPFGVVLSGTSWTVQSLAVPHEAKKVRLAAAACSTSTACETVGSYENPEGKTVPLSENYEY